MLLGGDRSKKGSLRRRVQQPGVHLTAGRPAAQAIERLPGVALAPMVHQGIGRTAVETQRLAIRTQQRQIGDAAQVEHRDGFPRHRKARRVEGRDQWRTLPARGHVAAAQVADHVDAGQLGEQRPVQQLAGVAGAVEFARAVPDRLPVGADGLHFLGVCTRRTEQGLHDVGVAAGDRIGGQRHPVGLVGAGLVQGQEFAARGRVESPVGMRAQDVAGRQSLDQHAVDPVKRGPGHQTDEQRHGASPQRAAAPIRRRRGRRSSSRRSPAWPGPAEPSRRNAAATPGPARRPRPLG